MSSYNQTIMKPKVYLILIALAFCGYSCGDNTECEGNQITLPNGDFLTIPSSWTHEEMPGIDSYTGQITYNEEDVFIIYDIGGLAGSYVEPGSTSKITESSDNEQFWYEEVDREYLDDEDCCVFVTFFERGPANFVTPNDENFEKVLKVLKTYSSN